MALRDGTPVGITVGGSDHELSSGDLLVAMKPLPGYQVEREGSHAVALELDIDDELRVEGWAREIVHAVQAARRDAGLDVTDRIALTLDGDEALVALYVRISRDAPPPLDAPAAIVHVVTRAMAKQPELRQASAEELGRELQQRQPRDLGARLGEAELQELVLAVAQHLHQMTNEPPGTLVPHPVGHRMSYLRLFQKGQPIGMRRAQFVNRSVRVSKIGSLGAYDEPERTGYDLGAVGKLGMIKGASG